MVDARLSVDAMLEQFALRVDVVYHGVSIEPCAGSEHRYFVKFVHFNEHLLGVGPYVERGVDDVALLSGDGQPNVSLLLLVLVSHTVR